MAHMKDDRPRRQTCQTQARPKTPFYRSVWFIGMYVLVVGGGLVSIADSLGFAWTARHQETLVPAGDPPPVATSTPVIPPVPTWPAVLDTAAYNAKMLSLAHYVPPKVASTSAATSTASSTPPTPPAPKPYATATTSVSVSDERWPTATVYPQGDAILPFKRIIAYYGNFYSQKMGVLGEYPKDEVLAKLASTSAMWEKEDPTTPTIPAIQYIAVVAQGQPGADGMWRARMPDSEIQQALEMADTLQGLLILDVQVGKSTLQKELPPLKQWLELPNVELAIDPEFSMKTGRAPGTVIGSFDADDINFAAAYLAEIVRDRKLAPKVLVVHRFTYDMVTNTEDIRPLPEVEIVMDMDGWGDPARKFGTYTRDIEPYPVQFTGMKLFYHADLRPPSTRLLTPAEVLGLTPAPSYIQYQ